MRFITTIAALLFGTQALFAQVTTRPVEYRTDKAFAGLILTDPQFTAKRPGILLAHPGGAAGVDARSFAAKWAKLGYVVFSVDLFGKGVAAPRDDAAAATACGVTKTERAAVRKNLQAAYTAFAKQPDVDDTRLIAIGYGVGATAALELARSGVDLVGLCLFHPTELASPSATDYAAFQPNVLLLAGAADPNTPAATVRAFQAEMKKAEVDCYVTTFQGVAGDFTNLNAGRNVKSGKAYSPEANKKGNDTFLEQLNVEAPIKRSAPRQPAEKALGEFPEKVMRVLAHVDNKGEAMPNYEGGRNFLNVERNLPKLDQNGKRVKYREWDVNPLMRGVNRGAERLVTGSDGKAYYTSDHYKTFRRIR